MLPFARFAGADAVLGPEMKSTGEVMGIAADFPTAFGKAQAAAGASLPSSGSVFVTVTDTDKPAATQIAARFCDLGFEVIATGGTAQAIAAMGVPVRRINKIAEGSPNVVDLIRERHCDLVINTPTGSGARADGQEIRTAAVREGIPCVTTMTGASAAVRAIAARKEHEAGVCEPSGAARARRSECRGRGGWLRAPTDACSLPSGGAGARSSATGEAGGYRIFSLLDSEGPAPRAGQFYMLATAGATGGRAASAPSCRGPSRWRPPSRRPAGVRLDFLVEASARGPTGSAGWTRARRSG